MRTIERNYRKNPHTANFLMKFHQAAYGLASEISGPEDLLDSVPVDVVPDHRSDAQKNYMEQLITSITELSAEDGQKARAYTDGMTEHGRWTPGREGNASAWITRMITKKQALRVYAPVTPTALVTVADGRYAVEEGGTLKFFKVKNGRRPGFVFLDIQASDEWHSIRNVTRIREVLALIAQDPKGAMIRYGRELGECGHCGRTLTDETSRAIGRGPICRSK